MIKTLIFAGLLAFALSQGTVNNLSQTESVVILTPGVNATTGFSDQVGSQFKIWVPSNVSAVNITWQRSPTDSSVCPSSSWAYLIAKWGSWPCYSGAYDGITELCSNGLSFPYSNGPVITVRLEANTGYNLNYWDSGVNYEFRRGEWLYFASYLDQNYNCTATVNIAFDGCPAGQIATEGSGETVCSTYTNVTGNTFTETVYSAVSFTKFYLVHVPVNASGVRVMVSKNDTNDYIYVYGRVSSGSTSSSTTYYNYGASYYNQTVWFPNPPAGDFVVSIETSYTDVTLDVTIQVEACTGGVVASDEYGNCTYPLTSLSSISALTTPITVSVPALGAGAAADCNWAVYGLTIPANTYSFVNLTVDIPASSGGYVYLRKNAFPLTDIYDEYNYGSTETWNMTPEDLYMNSTTIYYIGFCNPTTTGAITFTASATVKVAPSPSPSSSPSFVPSPSASASPEPDNSGSSAVVSIVVMLLAAVVVMF